MNMRYEQENTFQASSWEEIENQDTEGIPPQPEDPKNLRAEQQKALAALRATIEEMKNTASSPSASKSPDTAAQPKQSNASRSPINKKDTVATKSKIEKDYDRLFLQLDKTRAVLIILFYLLPSYVFWLFACSVHSVFSANPLSNGVSTEALGALASIFLGGGLFIGLPALLIVNGLSYRIVHLNKLNRRVIKAVDQAKAAGEKEKGIHRGAYLELKGEVEDLPCKIMNPAGFFPWNNEWAKDAASAKGVYYREQRWERHDGVYRSVSDGQLRY